MERTVWGVFIALAVVVAGCGGVTPEGAAGPAEGIAVHGDWTIEVYDPDGTLAESVEFSNDLTSFGREMLTDFLGRRAAVGRWGIGFGAIPSTGHPCFDDVGGPSLCVILEPLDYSAPESETSNRSEDFGRIVGLTRITLQGTKTAYRDGEVTFVQTRLETCPYGSTYPDDVACTPLGDTFTETTLPNPIPVVDGQSVQVEVVISFTSG